MKIVVVIVCLFGILGTSVALERLLIDQLRWDFLVLEDELWKTVLDPNAREPEYLVVRKFYDFDRSIQEMPEDILRGLDPIRSIPPFLFLYSDMKLIHNLYEKFREFQNKEVFKGKEDRLNPEDLIHDILFGKHSANKTITNIYNLTFGSENMIWEVFTVFDKDGSDFMCKNPFQSQEQVFYNLYNSIALTGLKCYMLQQFAYLISRIYSKENHTNEAIETRNQFLRRVNDTVIMFKGTMTISSKKIWRCDPNKHEKGQTYEEITKLLQGHIQNEVDLNNWGTCTKNCAAYTISKNYGCFDSTSDYCRKIKKCNGLILGCRFIESKMEVCMSPSYSPRRYEYVKYNSGKTMGHSVSCANRVVKSWHRWFVHCSYCMCLCDETGPQSDRYISLRSVKADIDENKVITGLRFVKANRIIHLQVQEGKLLPYGYIDPATVRWVPVEAFNIFDAGIKEGTDYFTLTYQHRTMVLDNLFCDEPDHIVTGVKFVVIDGNIRFQIKVNPFNYKNGTVILKNSYNLHSTSQGEKINLDNVDIPTKSPRSEPNFQDNPVVQFTHTSFDLDVAQTTVPFFDLQPTYSDPAVPLRGAGMFYKGKPNYGGFITPVINTYDFGKHLNLEFPNMTERVDNLEELLVSAN